MRLLAIDPGGACLGWAYFIDRRLVGCGLSRSKAKSLAGRIEDHLSELDTASVEAVVCERMVWRGRSAKSGPQDLMDLNIIAGRLGTVWVTPEQWKGCVPKEIHQPRILSRLMMEELYLVRAVLPPSLRHNAIDAVGIGLHHLGRLTVDVQSKREYRRPHTTRKKVTRKK